MKRVERRFHDLSVTVRNDIDNAYVQINLWEWEGSEYKNKKNNRKICKYVKVFFVFGQKKFVKAAFHVFNLSDY